MAPIASWGRGFILFRVSSHIDHWVGAFVASVQPRETCLPGDCDFGGPRPTEVSQISVLVPNRESKYHSSSVAFDEQELEIVDLIVRLGFRESTLKHNPISRNFNWLKWNLMFVWVSCKCIIGQRDMNTVFEIKSGMFCRWRSFLKIEKERLGVLGWSNLLPKP